MRSIFIHSTVNGETCFTERPVWHASKLFRYTTIAAAIVLAAGCSCENAAPPPVETRAATENNEQHPLPAPPEEKPDPVPVEKQISEPENKPAEEKAAAQTDEFGLPLVIDMEVPDVPEEISKSSPPIENKPDEAPKKSRRWWWGN